MNNTARFDQYGWCLFRKVHRYVQVDRTTLLICRWNKYQIKSIFVRLCYYAIDLQNDFCNEGQNGYVHKYTNREVLQKYFFTKPLFREMFCEIYEKTRTFLVIVKNFEWLKQDRKVLETVAFLLTIPIRQNSSSNRHSYQMYHGKDGCIRDWNIRFKYWCLENILPIILVSRVLKNCLTSKCEEGYKYYVFLKCRIKIHKLL